MFNDLLYATLGIVLSVPTSANNVLHADADYVPFYAEAPYSQESSQLHITMYSVNKDIVIQPKRNYRKLYESIAESKWFANSYKGKPLGEFIEVEL